MSVNSNASILQPSPQTGTQARTQTSSARWWLAYTGALKADIAQRRRDWRAKLIVLLGVAIALVAALLTAREVASRMADRAVATEVEQERWLGQGVKNAHTAAHYGIYVFKPVSTLSAIEPGIERYVGSTVWLEAHKQNEFSYRPANDQPNSARQLSLTPAFVLQVLAPLAMAFLGFGLFAAERERSSLRALRMTAAPFSAIGAARATTIWLASLVLSLPAVLAIVFVSMWHGRADTSVAFADPVIRGTVFTAGYAVYLAAWALVIASVSAWARSTRAALAVLIALWALWTLVLPRAAVEVADKLQPLPSAQAFREAMTNALGEPHDPDVEAKQKAAILAQYGVKDIAELPVNWRGISLAQGEAKGDRIFDEHYGKLFTAMDAQSRLIAHAGWLSPTVAVASLAGAAAASDNSHHQQFVLQAETHRRLIQKMMNDFITANPDRNGQRVDGDKALWQSVPPFQFQYAAMLGGSSTSASSSAVTYAAQLGLLLLAALSVFLWRCKRLAQEGNA
jgi:ABC-2 type transport system permease protein